MSTMREEAVAPEDEMLGMVKFDRNVGTQQHQPQHRPPSDTQRDFSNNSNMKENSHMASTDDENRAPPPVADTKATSTTSEITTKVSDHPDFYSWKREMKEMMLMGTVATTPTKSKIDTVYLTDMKLGFDKNRLERQLKNVKSDSSTATAPETSDDHSSSRASSKSLPLPVRKYEERRNNNRKSKKNNTSEIPFDTIYVIKETGKTKKRPDPPESSDLIPPQSPPTSDPSGLRTADTPLSPKTKANNSTELGAIMEDFKELMVELSPRSQSSEKQPRSPSRRRKSTPPTSPTALVPPTRSKDRRPDSSSAPPLPKSIVVPHLYMIDDNKYKHMIENRTIKDQGIPSEVLTITTITTARKKRKKKRKKRVRFSKPLITETQYRPKTAQEDVDGLYFQEEELEVWEKDELTTSRDRFEISLSLFRNSNDELDEETQTDSLLSFAEPVVSFHDSYSFSSCESFDVSK